jgi:hypothetical protein
MSLIRVTCREGQVRRDGRGRRCIVTRPDQTRPEQLAVLWTVHHKAVHGEETKKRLQTGCVNESRLFLHASDAGHGMVRWNVMEARSAASPRLVSQMSASDVTPLVSSRFHLAAAKRRGSKAQHRNACRLEYP